MTDEIEGVRPSPKPSVESVLFDEDGRLRTRRLGHALRGRNSHYPDLVPAFKWVPLILLSLIALVVLGGTAPVRAGHLFEILAWLVFGYVTIGGGAAYTRVRNYYADHDVPFDEEPAIDELRSRYAEGTIDLEGFEREVERVYEQGPEAISDSVDADRSPEGPGEPVAILGARYARGEIEGEEYRSKLRVLADAGERWSTDRTGEEKDDHGFSDETADVDTLRAQYTTGEISLEEFQRRVDGVFGPGVDPEPRTGGEDRTVDRDHAAILRERFARGEIDAAEFRDRMSVLARPVQEVVGGDRLLEHET